MKPATIEMTVHCELAVGLAIHIRGAREELTRRWLERIAARVAIDPNRIFPTDELLDHVPLLMDGIAAYLENAAEEISADMPVIAKAIELGELRFSQGFGAHEILKEYEILGGVIFAYLVQVVDHVEQPCTRGELLACGHRVFRAVSVIQHATTTHYLRMADERVREREERLRGFNRMVSHEMKNRIGTVLGAAQMLGEDWIANDPAQRARFTTIVADNAEEMQSVLQNLIELSRMDADSRQQRNLLLPEVVAEAVRQLREFAHSREVHVRVADDLPRPEVNAAAVELCLTNYISNAIKYSDPEKPERWVQIRADFAENDAGEPELRVAVADNGAGVPAEAREHLFERFFRAGEHRDSGIEGTGLGLSIVQETIESLGGRAWAEFGEEVGSTFFLALPSRRQREHAADTPGKAVRSTEDAIRST